MAESSESPDEDKVKGVADLKKLLKAPNRKKYDEDLERILVNIKEKEVAIKSLNYKTEEKLQYELKAFKKDKETYGEKRKESDSRLKALNLSVNQKMQSLTKLQCNLHYRNEEKVNEAIRKLELQLNNQNFRLSEEKKIVAEIDSLKRSKRVLSQYLALKKEIDGMRDQQKRIREERDNYFEKQRQLKTREELLKKTNSDNKEKYEELKKVIDDLYNQKRKLVADFKQQEKDFQEMKGVIQKQKKRESLKRREEEKKAKKEAAQREIEEIQLQTDPYVDERNLCNTLVMYLQRHIANSDSDLGSPATTPASTPAEENKTILSQGPAEKLEDGALVLLKRDEFNEYGGIGKRTTKRSRKSRKSSVLRPINHTPQIFAQFASLTLNAPSNAGEIPASIEQLLARKAYYEQLGHRRRAGTFTNSLPFNCSGEFDRERAETWSFMATHSISDDQSLSEAGNSATESAILEMSRQASKTESQGSNTDTVACDIMDDLVKASDDLRHKSCDSDVSGAAQSTSSEETIKSGGCDDDSVCSQVNSEVESDSFLDKSLDDVRAKSVESISVKAENCDKSSDSVCYQLERSSNFDADCDIKDDVNYKDKSVNDNISSCVDEESNMSYVMGGNSSKRPMPPSILVTDSCRDVCSLPVDEMSLTAVENV